MNKLSLLTLLTLIACQPQTKLVTEKWLSSRQSFVPARVPAAGGNPSCRRDLFTLEEIKREAQHYETQLASDKKIKGKWKHLDLEKLPVPQAKFLKLLGNDFGDLNAPTDVSSCGDVPCVVNKVYGSSDGLEGWATYLWYLKMGHILTFKNKLHKQKSPDAGTYNGKQYPLADYLFSRDELYAFWRMSHALTTPFKMLTDLKEIQRVPRKALFEDSGPMTCGLAYANGYVQLNDGCLSFGFNSKDTGFIYEGPTHEMGHHIDYHWGRRQNSLYFSQIGKWQEMGGWTLKEELNTQTNKVERKWVTTLKDEEFVRAYAKNSPAEHFADTAAYYRYQGDMTKRKIPKNIFDFLRDDVYEGKSFDTDGLLGQFKSEIAQIMSPQVFKAALECEQNPTSAPSVTPLPAELFPFNVSVPIRKCLSSRLTQLEDIALIEVKLNHVDGCESLKSNDRSNKFKASMNEEFKLQMVEHIKTARQNQEYYLKLAEFYKALEQRAVPLKLMTDCYGEIDEKLCYQDSLTSYLADLIPGNLQNAESLKEDLRKMFLETNRFEVIRVEMMKVHQDFIRTQVSLIDESAKRLWDECASGKWSNQEAPIPGPFSVGEEWMVSSQFNCLSLQIPDDTRVVVGSMSFDALGVSHGKENRLLFDLTLPLYVSEVSRLYEKARTAEKERVDEINARKRVEFKQNLLSNFSWAKGVRGFRKDCEASLWPELPRELRYHLSENVFGDLVNTTCSEVLASPEFKSWLESQTGKLEEHVLNTYLHQVEALSDERARSCASRFPVNNVNLRLKNKKERETCFHQSWETLTNQAWKDTVAEVGSDFKIQQSLIVQRADLAVKRIQGNVKRKHFAD